MERRSDSAHAHEGTSLERNDMGAIGSSCLSKDAQWWVRQIFNFNSLLSVNNLLDQLIPCLLITTTINVHRLESVTYFVDNRDFAYSRIRRKARVRGAEDLVQDLNKALVIANDRGRSTWTSFRYIRVDSNIFRLMVTALFVNRPEIFFIMIDLINCHFIGPADDSPYDERNDNDQELEIVPAQVLSAANHGLISVVTNE